MNKGEIWLIELPMPAGHEQTGTRPAIIISDTEANITIIIPLTSNIQALRFPHTIEITPSLKNGLSTLSIALIFHIRAIDKNRLKNKIGDLESEILDEIDEMLKRILQLQ